jgi:thiamine-monophosphate kinase
VSGDVGGAYLGLTLMEREKKIYQENPNIQPDLEDESYIVGKLLKPEARKDIIEFFASNQIVPTAMMDVSDGISSEVLHICKQSNLGARVYEEKLPIADASRKAAFKFGLDPTVCALNGGEDYELIFTIAQEDHDKIVLNEEISVIGYITDLEEGVKLLTKGGNQYDLKAQGWNAFNS